MTNIEWRVSFFWPRHVEGVRLEGEGGGVGWMGGKGEAGLARLG